MPGLEPFRPGACACWSTGEVEGLRVGRGLVGQSERGAVRAVDLPLEEFERPQAARADAVRRGGDLEDAVIVSGRRRVAIGERLVVEVGQLVAIVVADSVALHGRDLRKPGGRVPAVMMWGESYSLSAVWRARRESTCLQKPP